MTKGKYILTYKNAIKQFLDVIPDNYDRKQEIINLSVEIINDLLYKAPEIINGIYRQYIFKFTPLLPEPTEDSWGPQAWNHLVDGYEDVYRNTSS